MNEVEVRSLARAFVARASITGMPDIDAYARAAQARIRYEDLPQGESGMTIQKGSGYVITVNSNESSKRQRFTICHEIAHLELGLPTEHTDVPSWRYAKRHINEIWCDIFASELLMPYQKFAEKIPADDPSAAAIEWLADEFGASFPATASRYASLVAFPCAYVIMTSGMVRFAEPNAVLRTKGLRMAMKCPIPPGTVAHRLRAARENAIDTGAVAQDVWFENGDSGYEIHELSRHYGDHDETISLIWCTDEDLPRVELDRFNRRVQDDEGLEPLDGIITWEKHGPRRR